MKFIAGEKIKPGDLVYIGEDGYFYLYENKILRKDQDQNVKEFLNMMQDVQEFHERFNMSYDGPPRALPEALSNFRIQFIWEELTEYIHAIQESKLLVNQLDALVDLAYVVLGTAYLHGFNLNRAWRRVHAANMAKQLGDCPEHDPQHSHVVKPPSWVPPSLEDLVRGSSRQPS